MMPVNEVVDIAYELRRQVDRLGQRFLDSNHIRLLRRVCMTKCG
jgi:hypothetical protein